MKLLKCGNHGEKIFVTPQKGALKVKASIQKWVNNHRKDFEESDRKDKAEVAEAKREGRIEKAHLSVHGNRHYFCQRRIKDLKKNRGLSDRDARKQTSVELGHNREEIISVYNPEDQPEKGSR